MQDNVEYFHTELGQEKYIYFCYQLQVKRY